MNDFLITNSDINLLDYYFRGINSLKEIIFTNF